MTSVNEQLYQVCSTLLWDMIPSRRWEQIHGYAFWDAHDYHISKFDESRGNDFGGTTRIDIRKRGLIASIDYAKEICESFSNKLNAFCINPEKTWITLKVCDDSKKMTLSQGWTTYIIV
jgi:hypothetical protein